jgi:hypothetical protein
MSLNELFKSTFGEPIIDTDLTLEEQFNKLFEDLPKYRQQMSERYKKCQ